MSGFGSNDNILIIKLINQCGLVVPIADAMLSRVLINIESSKGLYIFNARTSTQNFKVENFNFQFRDFVRKNNKNNEGLQSQTLNIPSKWLNEHILSQNRIKIYFENIKGGTLIFLLSGFGSGKSLVLMYSKNFQKESQSMPLKYKLFYDNLQSLVRKCDENKSNINSDKVVKRPKKS